MHKNLRIVIAAMILVAILLLARNPSAWAGFLRAPNEAASTQMQPASGLAALNLRPGTVKPPPAVVPPITAPGTYSVGGICTFRVIQLAESISLHADLLPFTTLGKRPESVLTYLAGVCRAIYTQAGTGIIDLSATDGQVEICFAAIPNTTGSIFVYNDKTWTALTTTVQDGLACAPAQQTGKYVLLVEK